MFHQWNSSQYITYILLTLVFLSSWTDINGIYAELPQIVLTQPEHWKLGAYLGLITNLGNIAPLTLVLIKCFYSKYSLNPVPINYIVILVGMISCFLLIFFWSYTTIILNEKRSTALLILSFFLSLLDCTSSISFADYLHQYRKEFTSTLFLGESLTSILPSLLAIAQGNGRIHCIQSMNNTEVVYETARFSVSIYFLCLFILLTISFLSFVILQWTSIAQNSHQNKSDPSVNNVDEQSNENKNSLTTIHYLLLSFCCIYINIILFGIILPISTYVLMPYGHTIFYLGTILSPWMFILIWFLGLRKPLISKRYMLLFIILGTMTFAFDIFVSFKSPCPPLVNTTEGCILILIIWLSTYIFLGYPRLIIANYVRVYSTNGMFWFGVHVQLGALIGSIIAYILIDTLSLFHERLPCEQIFC